MNKLTKMVLDLQGMDKQGAEYDLLFTEIYRGTANTIDYIVNEYAYSLKGDVHEGESVAIRHLQVCCEKFNYEGYEFLTFFKKTLHRKLIDLVRAVNAEKVRHQTSYEISLSFDNRDDEGYSYGVEDRVQNEGLRVVDNYRVEEEVCLADLLDEYSEVKPVEAGVIELCLRYTADGFQKKDLTNALADYYGAENYTGTIQKRVSRAKESFKKYASENGYVFSF